MNDSLPTQNLVPLPPEPGYPAYGPVESHPARAASSRIKRFFLFLRRLWWVALITIALSVGGSVALVVRTPPTFASYARMWETEKLRLPEGAAFIGDAQNSVGTQMELLKSSRMAQNTIARLQAAGTNAVPLDKEGRPLAVDVRVSQAPRSSIFIVQASSSHPAYTQAYLNALMEEYMAYKKNVRKLVSGDTLASISEQVLRLERDLKIEQEALTSFQRTNNLAILQEEGTIAGGYLARLKTQLSDLKLEAQLLDATAIERAVTPSGATNSADLVADSLRAGSSSASPSSAVTERQTAFKELELLRIQREKLSKYLRPKHPKIARLDADIERAQTLLDLYRNQSRDQLAAGRQAVRLRIENVENSIKEWQAKVVEANARIAEAERLRLNVSRSQGLYDRLVIMLQNVDISRNIDQETLAVFEPASPAQRSYAAERKILTLGFLAGLALGIGIIFLIEVRDDRFTSLGEASEKLAVEFVGQVPEVALPRRQKALPLLESDDQRHWLVESYRSLRSALLFFPFEGERPKIVLVTSALPNEGKSTIAANLARSLALGGSRVLLVDGDMRRGQLHESLGLQSEPGLVELLLTSADLDQVVQTNSMSNLYFIARGKRSIHSGDLLLRPELDQILARWREQFDQVIIDSSPVFAAADVTTLAPKVDGTLLVVRNRYSGAGAVREALDHLCQRQARVLGLVFNRASTSGSSYSFYKYAGYQHPAKSA